MSVVTNNLAPLKATHKPLEVRNIRDLEKLARDAKASKDKENER
jgi:hypothetical protein